MKATYITEQGDPDVLTYGDVANPDIGPQAVLVKVVAAALNHLDLWTRAGGRGQQRTFDKPHILGADVAGTVEATGPDVQGVQVGQRVLLDPSITDNTCDYCRAGQTNLCRHYRMLGQAVNGGYAEYTTIPVDCVHPIPDSLSFEEAAAMPLTFQTAYHMMVTRAGLRPGDHVLVQAAGSGVGSAAIQIAKALGAWVVTTAGTDAKVAKGIELGADAGINYNAEPEFGRQVRELTDGEGVDIVIDHIGAATYDENINSLKRGGNYVNCGVTAGARAELHIGRLFTSHISLHGSFMGTKHEVLEWMRLVRDGRLKGVVGEIFDLKDAAEAHRRMESRDFFGKLLLKP